MELAIVVTVVVVALAFDYTNGFHDAANAIATSVSTRALTPRIALTLAAVMNFVGALLGQEVAHTVSDVIDTGGLEPKHGLVIVLAGLVGAIVWNLVTWYFGLPSSSSHALIGGLVGAALAAGSVVHWATILDKVIIPMVLSPVVGFVAAFALMLGIMWLLRRRNPHRVHRTFRGDVSHGDGTICIDGDELRVFSEKDPAALPWKELGVDIVLESTGRFTKAEDARKPCILAPLRAE